LVLEKLFENINEDEPKVGDYVVIKMNKLIMGDYQIIVHR
jgi:hypothetical protein